MSGGNRRSAWLPVAIAAGAVIAVAGVVASLWAQVGEVQISLVGWLAMGFGVLLTLALGVGLMTLVFISSRRGYDEPDGDRR
jgi:dipeptide/tripeptide permease